MRTFAELERLAPEIAGPIHDRLRTTGIGLLGTIRRDGSPRVSPIEVALQEGRLYVGMMPGSQKARDVERDPRVALLTPVRDREDVTGEGKLFGRVERIADSARADDVLMAAAAEAGFDPEAVRGSPVFELLVDGAAWQRVEEDAWTTISWRDGEAVRHRRREGATGEVVDVPADANS
jgi:hypothetical protein